MKDKYIQLKPLPVREPVLNIEQESNLLVMLLVVIPIISLILVGAYAEYKEIINPIIRKIVSENYLNKTDYTNPYLHYNLAEQMKIINYTTKINLINE